MKERQLETGPRPPRGPRGGRGRRGLALAFFAAAIAIAAVLTASRALSTPTPPQLPAASQNWVTAWGASPVIGAEIPGSTCPAGAGLTGQTVRNVVFLRVGATAAQIISADEQIIAQAHERGLPIFGATITPFGGSIIDSPAAEQTRAAVNHWIVTSRAFDGVIDFAAAVANPANPDMLLPAYNSGDHLHPDDAGCQAMANAVNLGMLLR